MNSFEDIENIWKTRENIFIPQVELIPQRSKKEISQLRNKILIESGLLGAALLTIIFVSTEFNFQYTSTYIGLGLMLFTVSVYTILRLKLAWQLQKTDYTIPPIQILAEFQKFYKAQQFLHSIAYPIYVVLLNIAFGLYFYEIIFHSGLHTFWQVLSVLIYLAWMLVSVFYSTAKRTRKENEKTRNILSSFQRSKNTLQEIGLN